jgi:hypothetical protein
MKIVATDNFGREAVAEFMVAENIRDENYANIMCEALNKKYCDHDGAITHYKVMPDDYKLWRGMEELV